MDAKTVNIARTVLLAVVIILFALNVFSYFHNGSVNYVNLMMTGSFLLIYLITKRKN